VVLIQNFDKTKVLKIILDLVKENWKKTKLVDQ